MKILDIKVMSLIIILIFCLSPLSAIDFNGDNATAIGGDFSRYWWLFCKVKRKQHSTVSTTPCIYPLTNDILDNEPLYVQIRTTSQYNGLVTVVLEDGSTQYGFAKSGLFSQIQSDRMLHIRISWFED